MNDNNKVNKQGYNTGVNKPVTLKEAMEVIDNLLDFYVLNKQLSSEEFAVWQGAINLVYRYEYQDNAEKASVYTNKTNHLELEQAQSINFVFDSSGYEFPSLKLLNEESVVGGQEIIPLFQILNSNEYRSATSPLTIVLGKNAANQFIVKDLKDMPHLLIIGGSGTGKSVFLNTLILSILYRAFRGEVRFIMVDPRRVELAFYEGITHLLTPIVYEAKSACNALNWAINEAEFRYKLLAGYNVRNIESYNNQVREEYNIPGCDPDKLRKVLGYIVIVIDGLTDLMISYSKEIQTSIAQLTQIGRSAGIHLIISSQYLSKNVLTKFILPNFPSRVCFRLSSKADSRAILDSNGAETLGKGEMLFLTPNSPSLVRLHGAYVEEKEIEAIAKHIRNQRQPDYDKSILSFGNEDEFDVVPCEKDELFDDAVRVICEMGEAQTSVLQRRLCIRYGRAAAIINMMEREGLVCPPDESRTRLVNQSAYEYLEALDNKN